ncbi:MAG: hypothetical protein FWE98_06405 [Oscillospiraceae bacterium]|nr:hypothetical protein [Oscillospiraceae bacterium]
MESAKQQLLHAIEDLPDAYLAKLLAVALFCKEKNEQGIEVKNLFDPMGMFSHWDNPEDDEAWNDL